MAHSMPIIEARNKLTKLPEHFRREPQPGVVAVTRHGKPVLAVMSWDLYESIVETMEILGDQKLMKAFRQGVKEIAEGKGIPWEQVEKRLSR